MGLAKSVQTRGYLSQAGTLGALGGGGRNQVGKQGNSPSCPSIEVLAAPACSSLPYSCPLPIRFLWQAPLHGAPQRC